MADDNLKELFDQFSLQFAELCQARHDDGEEKYGKHTWMGNDLIRMMVEELADTVNYCHYQAVKLMLLQIALDQELEGKLTTDDDDQVTLGVKAFKGVKDVGWKK
jgi:hypothetical protein